MSEVQKLRQAIEDQRGRGLSESQIAERLGVKRGYVAKIRQGRVKVSDRQAVTLLNRLEDTSRSGRGKIVTFKKLLEDDILLGDRAHTFESPSDKRSRETLLDYSNEVEKMLAGEPYDLQQFRRRKVYVARTSGRARLKLELDEEKIRDAYEASGLDRLYRFEEIDTPKGKS